MLSLCSYGNKIICFFFLQINAEDNENAVSNQVYPVIDRVLNSVSTVHTNIPQCPVVAASFGLHALPKPLNLWDVHIF